jgi:hypothetical protein
MTIMASAPVPTQCRLDEAATVRLHPMTDHDELEHEGNRLRVVSVEQHDARCSVRVASPQGTTPEVLHCHFCGLAYPVPGEPDLSSLGTVDKPSCPPWCAWHVLDDGEGTAMHFSADMTVHPTGGGDVQRTPIDVSFDQDATADGLIPGSGRVVVANLDPLTTAEALELAGYLITAVRHLQGDLEGWARALVDDPATDPRHRQIVADLLRQARQDDAR